MGAWEVGGWDVGAREAGASGGEAAGAAGGELAADGVGLARRDKSPGRAGCRACGCG